MTTEPTDHERAIMSNKECSLMMAREYIAQLEFARALLAKARKLQFEMRWLNRHFSARKWKD